MKISIIGLGYVGLPLAVEFSKKFQVVGFDQNETRIQELKSGVDRTREIDFKESAQRESLILTTDSAQLRDCDVHIVTVPTPVDRHNIPDLTPLKKASASIGQVIKKGAIVVYESTVFPGCTEDECIPIIEKLSGYKYNVDFFAGYSPERINPGDHERSVTKIKKVVAGSTPATTAVLKDLYGSIITAGLYVASSIKVAEAAKVIENTQRDLNIAFVNELAVLFNKMGIDTLEVLEAAGTKWNFLNFRPGLVGGHCIGVDPYYLTYKAESLGYHPEVILAGRRINDRMPNFIANQVIKLMIKNNLKIESAKVLILGVTFKENCKDIRNSKVADLVRELKEFSCMVDVCDPIADVDEVLHEYGFVLKPESEINWQEYNAVVLAVAHREYHNISFKNKIRADAVLYDVKGVIPASELTGRL